MGCHEVDPVTLLGPEEKFHATIVKTCCAQRRATSNRPVPKVKRWQQHLILENKHCVFHFLVSESCSASGVTRGLSQGEKLSWKEPTGNCRGHKCRSRQIFGSGKDFCPNFPKLARKKFQRKWPSKKRLHFISCCAHFSKSKHFKHFCPNFPQTCPSFP